MFIQEGPILARKLCVRLEQAVLQLDIVNFVGLRFEFDHVRHGKDGPPGRPHGFGARRRSRLPHFI
jgi:hypothetical protein